MLGSSWLRYINPRSELRIVLLGNKDVGKSSAGNTILGREEFELKSTDQCVKRQGEVAGRKITVVEAPGWWINDSVEESSELLKQEIVLSVSLCPPGPHVLLLVLRLGTTFKANERRVVEGHMKLLTERVWSHTIVLFVYGDYLATTTIEQHIESEDSALQWLVEKCGNRYHVLNNKNRDDGTQVTELLEKIEEMVAANSGCHFGMDRKILQEVEERKRVIEERARERMMKVQKQREDIRAVMGDTHHLSEQRIVLLGYRSAGKSSAGNTILDREEFELKRTDQCVKRQGETAGRKITVVEAPGWSINDSVEESSELLKQEIVLSVSLCPPGPHALLLVLRLGTTFKANERRVLKRHMKLLTERVWSHTIVLFMYGDYLATTTIEQHIESEDSALQWLVEKCGNRYHVLNNENRDDGTQVTELLEKIEEMVAANSGCHFEMDRKILQKMEERKRVLEERARERMMKEQKQREDIRVMESVDTWLDRYSLGSSSVGSFISKSGSIHSLVHGSTPSLPSFISSGYGSMWSVPESVKSSESRGEKNESFWSTIKKRFLKKSMNTKAKTEGTVTTKPIYDIMSMNSLEEDISEDRGSSATCLSDYLQQTESLLSSVFIPEMAENHLEDQNSDAYRFVCPHAGQFQCKITSLVFEMEGKGEVLYRIVSWDPRLLDGLGQMQPAGPLYNIDCFEGSISHLHLPHCDTIYEENQVELAVAHFTGDNVEVIKPLKVTNTHVVIKVQGLSLFGLLINMFRNIFNSRPISAQVLLFYKEMTGKKIRKKLHIHLLPGNVPVKEVEKNHKGSTYFETSSTCQLSPGRKYRASCDPYVTQPKVALFECDYGPNYHPTFVVFCEDEDVILSILDDDGMEVWEPHQVILTSVKMDEKGYSTDAGMDAGAAFVDAHRETLIQRVFTVMEIADCLKNNHMISDEMYSNIKAEGTSQERMRVLYDTLQSGGRAVKAKFYGILKVKLPFLMQELESDSNQA